MKGLLERVVEDAAGADFGARGVADSLDVGDHVRCPGTVVEIAEGGPYALTPPVPTFSFD
jgi:hypothetical protein